MKKNIALVALSCLALTPVTAAQQPPAGTVASDPIRCWWKTDRTAVRVGERFLVVLTCGVIEAGEITVVPNVTQLDPGAVALTPFDVVTGVRRDDVVARPWRYIQYEYSVRMLGDGFFGQDVPIPALTVTYNLQAPGGGSTGRDQSYILPALPMRILSLVPRGADDIRDASDQTFAGIETRRFRSTAAMVAAGVAFAFAAVFVLLALARVAGRYRKRDAKAVRPLGAPSMLGGTLRSIADVRDEARRGGWTPELARRGLAALRVGAAVALGRPVAQQFVAASAREREGQLLVRGGLLRRRRALLSAPTTPLVIADTLGNGHALSPRTRTALEQLADGLRVLNSAAYGRGGGTDSAELDAALQRGSDAIRRIRLTSFWPTWAVR